jgi:hypothetical protein
MQRPLTISAAHAPVAALGAGTSTNDSARPDGIRRCSKRRQRCNDRWSSPRSAANASTLSPLVAKDTKIPASSLGRT